MPEVLLTLAVLACPIGMGLMMLLMMRGRRDTPTQQPTEAATDAEITRLRAEVDQLRAARTDAQQHNGDLR